MKKTRLPKETPDDITQMLKMIGKKVSEKRQEQGSNSIIFTESHHINRMTLYRIENGQDYNMSTFLQVIKAIGVSPEEFFEEII